MDEPGAENHREHNNIILLCVLVNSHIVGAVMSADTLTEFRVVRTTIIREEVYIEADNWEAAEDQASEKELEWQHLEDRSEVEAEES